MATALQHLQVADNSSQSGASQASASSDGHTQGNELVDVAENPSLEAAHDQEVPTGESMEHEEMLPTIVPAPVPPEVSEAQQQPVLPHISTATVQTSASSIAEPSALFEPNQPVVTLSSTNIQTSPRPIPISSPHSQTEVATTASPNGSLLLSTNGIGSDLKFPTDSHSISVSSSHSDGRFPQYFVPPSRPGPLSTEHLYRVPTDRSYGLFPVMTDPLSFFPNPTSGFHERENPAVTKEAARDECVRVLQKYERLLINECRQKTDEMSNTDNQDLNESLLKIYTQRYHVRTAVMKLSEISRKDMEMGEITHSMGKLYLKLNKPLDGITYLQKALECLKSLQNTQKKAASVDELLGDAYMKLKNKPRLASLHYDRAVSSYKELNDVDALVQCFRKQANLLSQIKLFDKAIKIREKAVELIGKRSNDRETAGDVDIKGEMVMMIGRDFIEARKSDEAEKNYRRAIEIWSNSTTMFSKQQSAECRKQIGMMKMKGNRVEATSEFNKALQLYDNIYPDGSAPTVDLLVKLTDVSEPPDQVCYFHRSWSMADDLGGSLDTAPLLDLLERSFEVVEKRVDIELAKILFEKIEGMLEGRSIDCSGCTKVSEFLTKLAEWFKTQSQYEESIKAFKLAQVSQAEMSGRNIKFNIDSEIKELEKTLSMKKASAECRVHSGWLHQCVLGIIVIIISIVILRYWTNPISYW